MTANRLPAHCWFYVLLTAVPLVAVAPAAAQLAAVAANAVAQEIVSQYLVTVQGEARQRRLQIMSVGEKSPDAFQAEGRYGWADAGLAKTQIEITRTPTTLSLRFTTPTSALVVAERQPDGSFAGTISLPNGYNKPVTLKKITEADIAEASSAAAEKASQANSKLAATAAAASTVGAAPSGMAVSGDRIRFIHMGGNDCPPCVAWRGLEFPKLEKMPVFQTIQNSYVVKTIKSPIPAEVFLPAEVKPLKARLERASAGRAGSPHQMLLVDGEVYDY
jgi:hypothetical protein